MRPGGDVGGGPLFVHATGGVKAAGVSRLLGHEHCSII